MQPVSLATALLAAFTPPLAATAPIAAERATTAPPHTPVARDERPAVMQPSARGLAEPGSPAFGRALQALRPFEVPGRPCLAPSFRPGQIDMAAWRRERDMRRDTFWLGTRLAQEMPERLLSSDLERRGAGYVYRTKVTGTEPVGPFKLGGRAAGVPVVVDYGAPWSFLEVRRRAREVPYDRLNALLPTLTGSSLSPGGLGHVRLHVFSPGGMPRPEVLARCEALRRLFRLPVLIEFTNQPMARPVSPDL